MPWCKIPSHDRPSTARTTPSPQRALVDARHHHRHGVSSVIANLTNQTIMMHALLAESVTRFNQAMADPAAAMLDANTDTGRALLENVLTQQARIIAYASGFKVMLVNAAVLSAGAHRRHQPAPIRRHLPQGIDPELAVVGFAVPGMAVPGGRVEPVNTRAFDRPGSAAARRAARRQSGRARSARSARGRFRRRCAA